MFRIDCHLKGLLTWTTIKLEENVNLEYLKKKTLISLSNLLKSFTLQLLTTIAKLNKTS